MVFERQIATAKRLIEKYGMVCVWTELRPGTPTAPNKPGPTVPFVYSASLVFLPENRIGYEWVRALVGTEIPEGGGYALMPAVDFEPTLSSVIEQLDGTELRPQSIDPLSPNGEIILYTVKFKS
jgi:hypothetical protein